MSRTDLIADTFTMMRNAVMAKKENVDVPASGVMKAVLGILQENNYIDNFKLIEDKKQGIFRIYLRYLFGKPAIKGIKRISKSSLRVYVRKDNIPQVLRGRGLAIISTSKGILTDKQARESGLGGEVLAYIY